MSQVAKLYIRGSLVTKIAKNLTSDQLKEVEKLMDTVWVDPEIQNGLHEFGLALKRTIKNEYCNHEIALQEARITFWRAAVDILYGNTAKNIKNSSWTTERITMCPSPRCNCSPIKPLCRKKIFQTWLFNYLKQIIRENVRPVVYSKITFNERPDKLALMGVTEILNTKNKISYTVEETSEQYIISADAEIVSRIANDIIRVGKKYKKYGIYVDILLDRIFINKGSNDSVTVPMVSERFAKNISMNVVNKEDGETSKIEPDDEDKPMTEDIAGNDTINAIRNRLSHDGQRVFDIIVNPPEDYTSIYKDSTSRKHMASYLGMTKIQLDNAMEQIRAQCVAVDHVPYFSL